MRFLLTCLLCSVLMTSARAQKFELVESFPTETSYDQPDLRQAHEVWLEMIEGAREQLLIETFYVRNHPQGRLEPIVAAVEKAAERGVKVYVIADAKFEKTYPDTLARWRKVKGLQLRVYDVDAKTGGVQHAKYFLVDGRRGYVGSQNFDWTSLEHIRELGVAFEEPRLARCLEQIFWYDWDASSTPGLPELHPAAIVVDRAHPVRFGATEVYPAFSPPVLTPRGLAEDEAELVRLLSQAQHSISLSLLTYSPLTYDHQNFYPTLDNALRAAATRGVKIRMIVSHWNLKAPLDSHLKSLDVLPGVEVRVNRIPAHSGGDIPFARVSHSKYLVIDDDKSWVSTSNWGRGYFHASRNISFIFLGAEPAGRLGRLFQHDWDSGYCSALP